MVLFAYNLNFRKLRQEDYKLEVSQGSMTRLCRQKKKKKKRGRKGGRKEKKK
jgi:hypothetical protein